MGRETLRRDLKLAVGPDVAGQEKEDSKGSPTPNDVDPVPSPETTEPKEPEKPKCVVNIPFLQSIFIKSTSEKVSGKPLCKFVLSNADAEIV